jgi:hypothetical protein
MDGLRRLAVVSAAVGGLALTGSASAGLPILDQLLGTKPGTSPAAATNVSASGGRLNGWVHPNGHGTDYFFEYGPTIAYGAKTSDAHLGGGSSWVAVAANISGLQASTTYHFRIAATNSRGTTRSDDLTFTTAAAPDPGDDPGSDPGPGGSDPGPGGDSGSGDPGSGDPGSGSGDANEPSRAEQSAAPDEPRLGKSVVVAPGDGDLFVRLPRHSTFVPLDFGSELPVGTEVNAARGSIALTSALPSGEVQTARFGGGRFVIRQGRGGYVDLYLRGKACPHRTASGSRMLVGAARTHAKPRLWGSDHGGRYRTHGRNSHATVRGTRWVIGDSCAGTLTRVSSGSVVVRDEIRHETIVLDAGQRYLARPRR